MYFYSLVLNYRNDNYNSKNGNLFKIRLLKLTFGETGYVSLQFFCQFCTRY